jgi:hypothetical protein
MWKRQLTMCLQKACNKALKWTQKACGFSVHLARRYEHMRCTVIYILLLVSSNVVAGSFDEDFHRHYDLVAIVTIDSKSEKYQGAYNITVDRVIYRYGEDGETSDKYYSTNVNSGDNVILVRRDIKKIEKAKEIVSDRPKTKKVESIRQDGCNYSKGYTVGSRVRLFSVEIEPGFYKNNACRLTTTLNENS